MDRWKQISQRTLAELGEKVLPSWEPVFYSTERIKLATGGEGSGKSYQAALYAVCHSVYDVAVRTDEGPLLYWIVGADYEDARKEFDYILDFFDRLGAVKSKSRPNSPEERCTLETKYGQTFITISAYDATKLGRDEPDGIVGAEISRWFQEAFLRCEGRLARKFGKSWGFFSGSFESSLGWLPAIWNLGQGPNERGIRSFSIPSWANPVRFPGGEDDPAIVALRSTCSPERFMERYGGRPAPPKGIVFDSFNPLLHIDTNLEFLPGEPVYLAIDPGTMVYSVLMIQTSPEGEVLVQDEIYVNRWTHRQVVDAVMAHPAWPLVKAGAIDVASRQAHMGMPVPLEEWYRDTGLALISAHIPLNDSIERVRATLTINPKTGRPRLRIASKCHGLISEMGGGPSPVDGGGPWIHIQHRDGFGPPEQKNNHSCMALAYFLASNFGLSSLTGYYPGVKQSGPVSYLNSPYGKDESVRWWK